MKQKPPTILAIKIDSALRKRIKQAAKKDSRTESSFARKHLAIAAEETLTKP